MCLLYFHHRQVSTKYLTLRSKTHCNLCNPTQNKLPSEYCYKYNSNKGFVEEYKRDNDGDLINVGIDHLGVNHLKSYPEFVTSSNVITPKYLVHAKKPEKK